MDKYIIVNINMFAVDSQVSVVSAENGVTEIGRYPIEELPNVVTQIAHDGDIYKVKIIGGAKYSQLIEFGINTNEMLKYNERKIEIEVI